MIWFIIPVIAAAGALALKIAEDMAYDSAIEAEDNYYETRKRETAKIKRKVKKYTSKYDLKYYTIEMEKSLSLKEEFEAQLKLHITEKEEIDSAVINLQENKAYKNNHNAELVKLKEMAFQKEESINDLKAKLKYIKGKLKKHRSKINQIKTEKKKLKTGTASNKHLQSQNHQTQTHFPFQNSGLFNSITKIR
ncbi:MAG: hypothetical protein K8F60_03755 [Melioribacteraceae bacterium]|nr:hypothetical protein [Melioribacteraceae bacterium]